MDFFSVYLITTHMARYFLVARTYSAAIEPAPGQKGTVTALLLHATFQTYSGQNLHCYAETLIVVFFFSKTSGLKNQGLLLIKRPLTGTGG